MRYLLPKDGQFYKANFHAHTTDSDGRISPEELVEGYKAAGYSVLAISDHNLFKDRSNLCTNDFLVLNSCEINPGKDYCLEGRLVHFGVIAKSQDISYFPEMPITDKKTISDSDYTELLNSCIKKLNDANFLVIYNHMRWSLDTDADLMSYDGLFGMEVYNYFSEILGVEDYNLASFLNAVRKGKKMFCVMGDDNHNLEYSDNLQLYGIDKWDCSFGAYNMIKSTELTYESIISAMVRGDFYCTTGPEIYELYIDDDGYLNIKTSPAVSITVSDKYRRCFTNWNKSNEITFARFKISPDEEFVLVVVTDKYGKKAITQSYHL